MGPNDIEMVRVYTRDQANPATADVTFPVLANFDVVVEVEAGTNVLTGTPQQYEVGVTVRNLTTQKPVPVAEVTAPIFGNIPGNWGASAKRSFTFQVQGQPNANDVFEVLAYLRVGGPPPDVSFATSPLFILHK